MASRADKRNLLCSRRQTQPFPGSGGRSPGDTLWPALQPHGIGWALAALTGLKTFAHLLKGQLARLTVSLRRCSVMTAWSSPLISEQMNWLIMAVRDKNK